MMGVQKTHDTSPHPVLRFGINDREDAEFHLKRLVEMHPRFEFSTVKDADGITTIYWRPRN